MKSRLIRIALTLAAAGALAFVPAGLTATGLIHHGYTPHGDAAFQLPSSLPGQSGMGGHYWTDARF